MKTFQQKLTAATILVLTEVAPIFGTIKLNKNPKHITNCEPSVIKNLAREYVAQVIESLHEVRRAASGAPVPEDENRYIQFFSAALKNALRNERVTAAFSFDNSSDIKEIANAAAIFALDLEDTD